MKTLLTIFFAVLLSGCAQLGHREFYTQVAPSKYPPTSNVMIFKYSNVDLDEIYELLFSDYLIIGKSGFNGPYENPDQARSYAKSIGADILITSSQFKETRTSFMNLSTPTTSTTYISGYSGSGPVYGTATTYGTQTTTIPLRVNRYDQDGIYLKNINNANPLWERTRSQYQVTGTNNLSGIWKNESYEIDIIQSGEQMVAFIKTVIDGDKSWSKDQLKMVFGIESGVGIYLMGNKTPMPSKFSINKFGFLEVQLLSNAEVFSFAKMP
ncbi:hypothetical protein K0I63_03140 [Shewanella rhizosphaerae]|uniref:hypothetical protein n=1 Tax=Shewanella rhizosphaerae TaxID=2864207 RepID=UPI001C65D827|nr:hypothetical protein [Shewanella rhizosphaerae]QYK13527.1 hypothetical protein K0I63_03140 [Shewanella rhizosphaerae]